MRARSSPAFVLWLIFLALQLGERGQHRQQHIANQFVVCRQMLLGEAVEPNTMRSQTVEMADRGVVSRGVV